MPRPPQPNGCATHNLTQRATRRRFCVRMCCHARALRNGADCCVRWAVIRKGEAATRDRCAPALAPSPARPQRAAACARALHQATNQAKLSAAALESHAETRSAPYGCSTALSSGCTHSSHTRPHRNPAQRTPRAQQPEACHATAAKHHSGAASSRHQRRRPPPRPPHLGCKRRLQSHMDHARSTARCMGRLRTATASTHRTSTAAM